MKQETRSGTRGKKVTLKNKPPQFTRRTGHTLRCATLAIFKASEGTDVIVVCSNQHVRRHFWEMVKHIIAPWEDSKEVKLMSVKYEIKFPSSSLKVEVIERDPDQHKLRGFGGLIIREA